MLPGLYTWPSTPKDSYKTGIVDFQRKDECKDKTMKASVYPWFLCLLHGMFLVFSCSKSDDRAYVTCDSFEELIRLENMVYLEYRRVTATGDTVSPW